MLTPIMRANSTGELPNRSRIARTSTGAYSVTRPGFLSPRRIWPASQRLLTRLSKS
jgi:hypothetical protein